MCMYYVPSYVCFPMLTQVYIVNYLVVCTNVHQSYLTYLVSTVRKRQVRLRRSRDDLHASDISKPAEMRPI